MTIGVCTVSLVNHLVFAEFIFLSSIQFFATQSLSQSFCLVLQASQGSTICQLMDLFAIPEMALFANVIEVMLTLIRDHEIN